VSGRIVCPRMRIGHGSHSSGAESYPRWHAIDDRSCGCYDAFGARCYAICGVLRAPLPTPPTPPTPPPPTPKPPPAICMGESADLAALECAAWQDLYDATDGPKWSHCSDARSDPCSCSYGDNGQVDCTGGHITTLHLLENNLRGTIPSSLAKLSQMTYLGLDSNRLTGLVP
jgi:hypothetical protein